MGWCLQEGVVKFSEVTTLYRLQNNRGFGIYDAGLDHVVSVRIPEAGEEMMMVHGEFATKQRRGLSIGVGFRTLVELAEFHRRDLMSRFHDLGFFAYEIPACRVFYESDEEGWVLFGRRWPMVDRWESGINYIGRIA